MAVTRIIPIRGSKVQSVIRSLTERTDYVKAPEKTENGSLVYAYGCTADGVITTPLTSVRVLTEAGSDTPPATAAKPRLVRVR